MLTLQQLPERFEQLRGTKGNDVALHSVVAAAAVANFVADCGVNFYVKFNKMPQVLSTNQKN